MRHLLLIAALACPLVSGAEERNFIQEFYDARKIARRDPEGAAEAMKRSFRKAVEARNADYATAAGANGCEIIYAQGRMVEAGQFAREVIEGLEPFEPDGPHGDALRRAPIFGYLERGLLMEGKTGAAWQANRAAAETLRGKKVAAEADGPSITVREVIPMRPDLRSLGWRLIEREAELLDIAGRSVEALALLDEAAAFLGKDWQRLAPVEHFYAFKLLSARATILDFLGEQRAAIEAQEALLAMTREGGSYQMPRLTLRLNLLRNLTQWDGPSEERLEQARAIGGELKAGGSATGADRLLAKMELDLRESKEALEVLRGDAKGQAGLGHWLEAVYADRDHLIGRARMGEHGLDAEFTGLLAKVRAQGNKRGEPNLYREYADYLLDRDRPAEAIPLLVEALRLTRSFGWTLHEPAILSALFNARFAAGDLAGARTTLAELEAFLMSHPDLPDSRRVPAEVSRAMAHARLGDKDAAKAALKVARELAKDLPEYQKRWLTPEAEQRILEDAPEPASPAPAAAADAPPLRVQPLAVSSIAVPGEAARTRFAVFNPAATGVRGDWKITGPGATADASSDAVRFVAGKPVTSLSLPRTVAAGGEVELRVKLDPAAGVTASEVRIAWENAGKPVGEDSLWDVSWDPAATGSVVLDASSLEAGPFRSVALFHELAVPAGESTGIAFRLRSPQPLRVEYYDSRSKGLVAIDANGNGDFTEPGDLHVRGPSGVAAAILPVPPGKGGLTVEVHLFAADGHPLPPGSPALVLKAEVHRGGKWVMEAEDTLR
jgi:tetratricopeptide (TPR) repeat protein